MKSNAFSIEQLIPVLDEKQTIVSEKFPTNIKYLF